MHPSPAYAIFEVAQRGNVEECERVVQLDRSLLTRRGWSGFTPLHYAAFQGNRKLSELFLKNGADPNIPSDAGQTAFHLSCRHGDVYVIHLMLKHGADLSIVDHQGKTALHQSVSGGNIIAIRYIEDTGVFSFSDTDKFLVNPLHLAVSTGNIDVVKYLLRNNRCQAHAADNQGMTAMHVAAERGAIEISWILLQQFGFQLLHLKNKGGLTPVDLCRQGTTYRHKQLTKILCDFINQPVEQKPKASYGMYYWALLFPAISGSIVLLIAAVLGKYGGIFCGLVFPSLAKSIFSQYHRMNSYQRLPNPIYLGTFAAGIFHSLLCFFHKIMPIISPVNALLLMSVTHFTAMLWMFRLVLTKDPGRLRRADTDSKFTTIAELVEANQNPYKFCIHCEMIQPDKSRHCKLCNICVLEYDHHCLFLNNCVAKNNHRIFVIFIMELIVAHVIFIVSALYYIYLKYNRPFLTVWTTVISEEVWVLVLTVMNAFTLIWESWLLKEQFEAISMGTTTYFKQNSDRRYSRSLRCRTFFMFLIEDKRRHDFQLERSIDI